jgi:hypothetical protein
LGFEGKTEKKKEAGTEQEKKKNWEKKRKHGVKGETNIGKWPKAKYSP